MDDEVLTWWKVENFVADKLIDGSLQHDLDINKKVHKSTKLMNKELLRNGVPTSYSQYVKLREHILENMTNDEETSYESDLSDNDFSKLHNTDNLSTAFNLDHKKITIRNSQHKKTNKVQKSKTLVKSVNKISKEDNKPNIPKHQAQDDIYSQDLWSDNDLDNNYLNEFPVLDNESVNMNVTIPKKTTKSLNKETEVNAKSRTKKNSVEKHVLSQNFCKNNKSLNEYSMFKNESMTKPLTTVSHTTPRRLAIKRKKKAVVKPKIDHKQTILPWKSVTKSSTEKKEVIEPEYILILRKETTDKSTQTSESDIINSFEKQTSANKSAEKEECDEQSSRRLSASEDIKKNLISTIDAVESGVLTQIFNSELSSSEVEENVELFTNDKNCDTFNDNPIAQSTQICIEDTPTLTSQKRILTKCSQRRKLKMHPRYSAIEKVSPEKHVKHELNCVSKVPEGLEVNENSTSRIINTEQETLQTNKINELEVEKQNESKTFVLKRSSLRRRNSSLLKPHFENLEVSKVESIQNFELQISKFDEVQSGISATKNQIFGQKNDQSKNSKKFKVNAEDTVQNCISQISYRDLSENESGTSISNRRNLRRRNSPISKSQSMNSKGFEANLIETSMSRILNKDFQDNDDNGTPDSKRQSLRLRNSSISKSQSMNSDGFKADLIETSMSQILNKEFQDNDDNGTPVSKRRSLRLRNSSVSKFQSTNPEGFKADLIKTSMPQIINKEFHDDDNGTPIVKKQSIRRRNSIVSSYQSMNSEELKTNTENVVQNSVLKIMNEQIDENKSETIISRRKGLRRRNSSVSNHHLRNLKELKTYAENSMENIFLQISNGALHENTNGISPLQSSDVCQKRPSISEYSTNSEVCTSNAENSMKISLSQISNEEIHKNESVISPSERRNLCQKDNVFNDHLRNLEESKSDTEIVVENFISQISSGEFHETTTETSIVKKYNLRHSKNVKEPKSNVEDSQVNLTEMSVSNTLKEESTSDLTETLKDQVGNVVGETLKKVPKIIGSEILHNKYKIINEKFIMMKCDILDEHSTDEGFGKSESPASSENDDKINHFDNSHKNLINCEIKEEVDLGETSFTFENDKNEDNRYETMESNIRDYEDSNDNDKISGKETMEEENLSHTSRKILDTDDLKVDLDTTMPFFELQENVEKDISPEISKKLQNMKKINLTLGNDSDDDSNVDTKLNSENKLEKQSDKKTQISLLNKDKKEEIKICDSELFETMITEETTRKWKSKNNKKREDKTDTQKETSQMISLHLNISEEEKDVNVTLSQEDDEDISIATIKKLQGMKRLNLTQGDDSDSDEDSNIKTPIVKYSIKDERKVSQNQKVFENKKSVKETEEEQGIITHKSKKKKKKNDVVLVQMENDVIINVRDDSEENEKRLQKKHQETDEKNMSPKTINKLQKMKRLTFTYNSDFDSDCNTEISIANSITNDSTFDKTAKINDTSKGFKKAVQTSSSNPDEESDTTYKSKSKKKRKKNIDVKTEIKIQDNTNETEKRKSKKSHKYVKDMSQKSVEKLQNSSRFNFTYNSNSDTGTPNNISKIDERKNDKSKASKEELDVSQKSNSNKLKLKKSKNQMNKDQIHKQTSNENFLCQNLLNTGAEDIDVTFSQEDDEDISLTAVKKLQSMTRLNLTLSSSSDSDDNDVKSHESVKVCIDEDSENKITCSNPKLSEDNKSIKDFEEESDISHKSKSSKRKTKQNKKNEKQIQKETSSENSLRLNLLETGADDMNVIFSQEDNEDISLTAVKKLQSMKRLNLTLGYSSDSDDDARSHESVKIDIDKDSEKKIPITCSNFNLSEEIKNTKHYEEKSDTSYKNKSSKQKSRKKGEMNKNQNMKKLAIGNSPKEETSNVDIKIIQEDEDISTSAIEKLQRMTRLHFTLGDSSDGDNDDSKSNETVKDCIGKNLETKITCSNPKLSEDNKSIKDFEEESDISHKSKSSKRKTKQNKKNEKQMQKETSSESSLRLNLLETGADDMNVIFSQEDDEDISLTAVKKLQSMKRLNLTLGDSSDSDDDARSHESVKIDIDKDSENKITCLNPKLSEDNKSIKDFEEESDISHKSKSSKRKTKQNKKNEKQMQKETSSESSLRLNLLETGADDMNVIFSQEDDEDISLTAVKKLQSMKRLNLTLGDSSDSDDDARSHESVKIDIDKDSENKITCLNPKLSEDNKSINDYEEESDIYQKNKSSKRKTKNNKMKEDQKNEDQLQKETLNVRFLHLNISKKGADEMDVTLPQEDYEVISSTVAKKLQDMTKLNCTLSESSDDDDDFCSCKSTTDKHVEKQIPITSPNIQFLENNQSINNFKKVSSSSHKNESKMKKNNVEARDSPTIIEVEDVSEVEKRQKKKSHDEDLEDLSPKAIEKLKIMPRLNFTYNSEFDSDSDTGAPAPSFISAPTISLPKEVNNEKSRKSNCHKSAKIENFKTILNETLNEKQAESIINKVKEKVSHETKTLQKVKRITKISQLIEKEQLVENSKDCTFELKNLTDDDDVWIFEIPKKVLKSDVIGEKFVLDNKTNTLKIGKDFYQTTGKSYPTVNCVIKHSKRHKKYIMTNIRPIELIVVQQKLDNNALRTPNANKTLTPKRSDISFSNTNSGKFFIGQKRKLLEQNSEFEPQKKKMKNKSPHNPDVNSNFPKLKAPASTFEFFSEDSEKDFKSARMVVTRLKRRSLVKREGGKKVLDIAKKNLAKNENIEIKE